MSNITIGGNINSPNVNIGGNQTFADGSIENDIHERAEFFKALCEIKLYVTEYQFDLLSFSETINQIQEIVDKCLEGYI